MPLATRRERVDATVAELTADGATVVRTDHTPEHDPEGNEFCVV